MLRVLDACSRALAERGMDHMLLDAVRGGEEGFQSLGEACFYASTNFASLLGTNTVARIPEMGLLSGGMEGGSEHRRSPDGEVPRRAGWNTCRGFGWWWHCCCRRS
jgi:hypothetical protein